MTYLERGSLRVATLTNDQPFESKKINCDTKETIY